MKDIFKLGNQKVYQKIITEEDQAAFHGEVLHRVCSTFALARDFEWSSRLFFIEMKEEDEEGVGTFLSIEHKSPAFVGEALRVTATIEKIERNELICSIEALCGNRIIAIGKTGQKMLKKDKLRNLFTKMTT
ncbi:MAG: hotdog domain-containing protein [Bacteroidota bacterium]